MDPKLLPPKDPFNANYKATKPCGCADNDICAQEVAVILAQNATALKGGQ